MNRSLLLLLLAIACGWDDPLETSGLPPDDPDEEVPEVPQGTPGIYVAASNWSQPRFVVEGGRPAWSPVAPVLAFQRGDSIHLIGIDGTGHTVLGLGREPAWSPDGHQLAFVNAEGIAVLDQRNGSRRVIQPHGFRTDTDPASDFGIGKPAWSPDGATIAFEHLGDGDFIPAQIFMVDTKGSVPRRVTPTTGNQYAESDPAWSPDGKEIVYWSFGPGIATVSSTGGAPRSIYRNFPTVAYGSKPVWSPRRAILYFTANRYSPEGPQLWAINRAGDSPRLLIPGGSDPSWAADGGMVAFAWRKPAGAP